MDHFQVVLMAISNSGFTFRAGLEPDAIQSKGLALFEDFLGRLGGNDEIHHIHPDGDVGNSGVAI